jgi:hypothetical protein
MVNTLDARAPRAQLVFECTLRRRTGSPIPAHTVVLGPRGMHVSSPRPLSPDETVGFELVDQHMRVSGRARVLRQERLNVYALRFEGLPDPMTRHLHALAINGPPSNRTD